MRPPAILLAISLLAAACGRHPVEPLDRIPGDADLAGMLDFTAVQSDPDLRRLWDAWAGSPQGSPLGALWLRLGLADPQALEEAWFGVEWATAGRQPGYLLVLRGSFREAPLSEAAKRNGCTEDRIRNRTAWTCQEEGRVLTLASPEPRLLLFGPRAWVERGLLCAEGESQAVSANPRIAGLRRGIQGKPALWLAGSVERLVASRPAEDPLSGVLARLDSIVFTASPRTPLELRLAGQFVDEEGASEAGPMLTGLLGFLRMATGDDADWNALLSALQIRSAGKEVALECTLDPDLLLRLSRKALPVAPAPSP